jgi:hypothetical protein
MLTSLRVASLAVAPGRLLLYNDVAARLFGPRHSVMLGRPLAEAFPESYPDVVPFYDWAFVGSTVVVPARPVAVSEAGREVFEATLLPVRSADGEVLAALMTGNEVGVRLQVKARQALLLSLGDALRVQSSTEDLIEVAAQLLGEHLTASSVRFAEFDEACGEADIFHGWFANGARPFPALMRLENYEGRSWTTFARAGRCGSRIRLIPRLRVPIWPPLPNMVSRRC